MSNIETIGDLLAKDNIIAARHEFIDELVTDEVTSEEGRKLNQQEIEGRVVEGITYVLRKKIEEVNVKIANSDPEVDLSEEITDETTISQAVLAQIRGALMGTRVTSSDFRMRMAGNVTIITHVQQTLKYIEPIMMSV